MATIKSYSDLEQSCKLAEILPIESADMFYNEEPDETYPKDIVDTKYPMVIREGQKHYLEEYGIPCWSLAALLSVLPDELEDNHFLTLDKEGNEYCCCYEDNNGNSFRHTFADNPVDACVAMIERLHELKML